MKYSVSTYSYSQLTRAGQYSEFDLLALAKKMGFDGIELADIHAPAGEDKAVYAARLRDEAARLGIELVSYTIGADFLRRENEAERLRVETDIAAILGVRLMRHDASTGFANGVQKIFSDALPTLAAGCRAVTRYAKTKGIRTMVENHGYFCQDSTRLARLVSAVGDENFGVLLDIGNFLCADEEPEKAVGRLAPFTFHVHAKDFHFKSGDAPIPPDGFFGTRAGNALRGAIIGHGVVPVLQCLRILHNNGYDGYITVEFEGMEPAEIGVAYGLNSLRFYESVL